VDGLVTVKVYGCDARDTQLLARVWRLLWYRDARPQMSFTRIQLVEHEALMLLIAGQSGVLVPKVIAAGTASGDAVLVTSEPHTRRLSSFTADEVDDDLLRSVFRTVSRLRDAGMGHGRLNADSILVDDHQAMLVEFQGSRLSAPPSWRGSDLAELLVSLALLAGDERTIRLALEVLGTETLNEALLTSRARPSRR
jgi:tRNA A-37 threonylcarbamoyl transferase component Bud32